MIIKIPQQDHCQQGADIFAEHHPFSHHPQLDAGYFQNHSQDSLMSQHAHLNLYQLLLILYPGKKEKIITWSVANRQQ